VFPADGLGLALQHHREGIPGTTQHDLYRVFREGTAHPHPDSARADRALPGDVDTHLDATPQRNPITHHHAEQHGNTKPDHRADLHTERDTDLHRQLVVIDQQCMAGS